MRLICKDIFDGELLIEVYMQVAYGVIDGEVEAFDEIYIYDFKTHKHINMDERSCMDTTYRDLYEYARDYLKSESFSVEEA